MDNLARKPTRQDVEAVMTGVLAEMGRLFDREKADRLGNGLMGVFPQDQRLALAARLMRANPLYVPAWPEADLGRIAPSPEQFADLVMSARIAVARKSQPNIMIACAPKSASTFISDTLVKATGLPPAILFTSAQQPTPLGANLREQEPDELSLLFNGLNGVGYVAQHHARASRRLTRLMTAYRIRPVVTYRTLFDTLVSLDDMLMEGRASGDQQENYFNDGLPWSYGTMDFDDRMDLLSARWSVWLTEFQIGWKALAGSDLKPVYVSYERDLQGNRAELAERMARELGAGLVDPARLAACLVDESRGKAVRINKGITGRGACVPAAVKSRIESIVRAMAPRELWDGLIGEG